MENQRSQSRTFKLRSPRANEQFDEAPKVFTRGGQQPPFSMNIDVNKVVIGEQYHLTAPTGEMLQFVCTAAEVDGNSRLTYSFELMVKLPDVFIADFGDSDATKKQQP